MVRSGEIDIPNLSTERRENLRKIARDGINDVNRLLFERLNEIGFLFAYYLRAAGPRYKGELDRLNEEINQIATKRGRQRSESAFLRDQYYLKVIQKVFQTLSNKKSTISLTTWTLNRFVSSDEEDFLEREDQKIRQYLVVVFEELLVLLETRLFSVSDVLVSKGVDAPIKDPVREQEILDQVNLWIEESGDSITRSIRGEILEVFRVVIDATVLVEERARISQRLRRDLLGDWDASAHEL